MGASATCGHRVARFMAPTNSVLIVALGTGSASGGGPDALPWPYPYCKIAKCCRFTTLPPSHPFSILASSSSLLQFCLNYFACLFMVESLISALVSLATLTTRRAVATSWLPVAAASAVCRMRGRDLDNAHGDGLRNERSLPPCIYDRRQARPDLRLRLSPRPVSRDRAIQVFRKMDYSCLLSLSGTHAKLLLLLQLLTTRMEIFAIGRRDVDQAKQLPYLCVIY